MNDVPQEFHALAERFLRSQSEREVSHTAAHAAQAVKQAQESGLITLPDGFIWPTPSFDTLHNAFAWQAAWIAFVVACSVRTNPHDMVGLPNATKAEGVAWSTTSGNYRIHAENYAEICRALASRCEQARLNDLASKIVVVATAGDLWKAYVEGMRPCYQCSGISTRPGANTPTITCTDGAAEAKRTALALAQALVTAEGGDKAAAMEKLIARVQLQDGMDKADVINMPLADFVAAARRANMPQGYILASNAPTEATPRKTPTKPKASTQKGDARTKLIAALTLHHEYGNGGSLKLEPIGNNQLARMAGVGTRTASAFFDKEFGGHKQYTVVCAADASKLVAAIKILNGEFSPRILFGGTPAVARPQPGE